MYFLILALLTAFGATPVNATDMHYPAGEEPVELPTDSPLYAKLPRAAQSKEDQKTEAMSLYLTLMREDENSIWAPYQLAVSSAEQGQTELAERYLQLSAERGLWYYYNLLEEDAFNAIKHGKTYQSILAQTKVRYQRHAQQYEGKASYVLPPGQPPAGGWPTVVYLHAYGKKANISAEDKQLFGSMGVAYIELTGTQMLSENSFRWSNYSDESTHKILQRALHDLTPQLGLNPQAVYLFGNGQGALHAANLLAKYPQFYAGGLLVAPEGEPKPVSQSLASNKRIVITYYNRQKFSTQAIALDFAKLFGAKNQVRVQRFEQQESAKQGSLTRFAQPLEWILGKAKKPKGKK